MTSGGKRKGAGRPKGTTKENTKKNQCRLTDFEKLLIDSIRQKEKELEK